MCFIIIITLIHDTRTKENDKYVLTCLSSVCSGYSTEMNISSSDALKLCVEFPVTALPPHGTSSIYQSEIPGPV